MVHIAPLGGSGAGMMPDSWRSQTLSCLGVLPRREATPWAGAPSEQNPEVTYAD